RVHQIWMGDRADDAKAASYSAQDMMIVERDIGRLAKYTFDMGGTGDLLSLALSVPPWEDLHQLSRAELRLSNLVTTDLVADVLDARLRGHDDRAYPTPSPAVSPRPRSGRSHRPRHRTSAWSRRAAPCNRAPAPAALCRPIFLAGAGRFPSASCERFRVTRGVRSRLSRPHGLP